MKRWADAVGILLRFAMSCDAAGAANSQSKCYLSAVVVWLYAGSAGQAWATYQVPSASFWPRFLHLLMHSWMWYPERSMGQHCNSMALAGLQASSKEL